MTLSIKPLSPELAADYFDFFDNRAFSDGSPYYPCYCNAFNMTDEQIKVEFFERAAENGNTDEAMRLAQRSSAERMVAAGIIRGYLVYDGDIVVGWCNANDKSGYHRFGDFDLDAEPKDSAENTAIASETPARTKSVVCFEVAPGYRGKGIATMLLERVISDARSEGYDIVEVYPVAHDEFSELQFTGPIGLFEKLGFERASRHGKTIVMRKKLK